MPENPFDLSGRVALVTGGSMGIGLGMAQGLAKAGANIAIWARNEERTAGAVTALRALGVDAEGFRCDVASEEQVVEATRATLERFGRIDAAFANAGYGTFKSFTKMTSEDWHQVLEVNLDGVFYTFREAAKHMIERGGGGKLIGISSIGEICGMARNVPYSASKGALGAIVRSLAVEFGKHDIQVNAVQPGWIETDATAPMIGFEKLRDTIVHRTPADRWGTPEDFAGIAVYLASEASRFHTGDTIRVDGGYMVF